MIRVTMVFYMVTLISFNVDLMLANIITCEFYMRTFKALFKEKIF